MLSPPPPPFFFLIEKKSKWNTFVKLIELKYSNARTELALEIAKEYKYLIGEKDMDGMTALQLLSCKPEAFKLKQERGFFKKLLHFRKLP